MLLKMVIKLMMQKLFIIVFISVRGDIMNIINLPNGITIINVFSTMENIFFASAVICAGSLNDHKLKGLAHFTEHMLLAFRKPSVNTAEYFPYSLKGTTMFDRTTYSISCPVEYYESAIKLLIKVIQGDFLDKNNIEYVRETILQEIKYKNGLVQTSVLRALLEKSTIKGKEPVGETESVLQITFSDVKKFWNQYYTADKIGIQCVSSIPFKTIIANIMDITGNMRKGQKIGEHCWNSINNRYIAKLEEIHIGSKCKNEVHIFVEIPFCKNKIDLILESLMLSIITHVINKNIGGEYGFQTDIYEFTNEERFFHFRFKIMFCNRLLINHVIKRIETIFLSNEIMDRSLIKRIILEYTNFLKRSYPSNNEIIFSLERTFIYKKQCYFTNSEMLNMLNEIQISDIEVYAKKILLYSEKKLICR